MSYPNDVILSTDYEKKTQRFNQPSKKPYNIIFPNESNFHSGQDTFFIFMFSLAIKAFVMFVTLSIFQSNYVV